MHICIFGIIRFVKALLRPLDLRVVAAHFKLHHRVIANEASAQTLVYVCPFFRPATAPLAAMFANAPSRYHGRRTRRSELQPVCPCNYGQLFFHCWTGANQRRKVGGHGATARHVVLRRRVAICLYLLLYLSLPLISRFGLAFCRSVISLHPSPGWRNKWWRAGRAREGVRIRTSHPLSSPG